MSANTARTVAAALAERRLCRDESTACIVYETIKRMVRGVCRRSVQMRYVGIRTYLLDFFPPPRHNSPIDRSFNARPVTEFTNRSLAP